MILNLRVYRLRGLNLQLLHTTPLISKSRWPSTSRSWQPSGPPNGSPSPDKNYISRRTTLMNYPHTRPKNRRSAWTPEPNRIYSHTTRRLLWTMLRNLRRKPQLHTNRRRADSTKNLWNRTCVHPITPITLCRPTVQLFQHEPFKLKIEGMLSAVKCPNWTHPHGSLLS